MNVSTDDSLLGYSLVVQQLGLHAFAVHPWGNNKHYVDATIPLQLLSLSGPHTPNLHLHSKSNIAVLVPISENLL